MLLFFLWLYLLHLNGKRCIGNGTFILLTLLLMFCCSDNPNR